MFFHNPLIDFAALVIFAGFFFFAIRELYEAVRFAFRQYKELTVWQPMRRRGEKMVLMASITGPIIISNSSGKGAAHCRRDLFEEAVGEWLRLHWTESENDPKKKIEIRLEPMVICVKPTFTFADNEGTQKLAHTGSRLDLEELGEKLVERVTGYRKSQVGKKYFDLALSHLVIRDKRLFVPFESDEKPPHIGWERQLEMFDGTTVKQAEKNLLPPTLYKIG